MMKNISLNIKAIVLLIVLSTVSLGAFAQTSANSVYYFKTRYSETEHFQVPDSLPDGKWIAYSEKNPSQQAFVIRYSGGKKNGEYSVFNTTGNLSGRGFYVDGKLSGKNEGWYPDGKLSRRSFFVKGKLKGKAERWYPNGNKQNENENFFVDKEPKLGTKNLSIWTNDGKQVMKNGTGEFISYYDDGSMYVKGNYLKDHLTGEWTWYYNNGIILRIAHFVKSIYTGVYKTFNAIGQPEEAGTYKKGLKSGQWQTYDYKGRLLNTTTYKKGRLDGASTEWNINGNKNYTAIYKKSKPDDDDILSYVDGKIAFKKHIEGFLAEGEEIAWYGNGNMKWKGNYKHNKRNGRWSFWKEDSTFDKTVKYINGTIVN